MNKLTYLDRTVVLSLLDGVALSTDTHRFVIALRDAPSETQVMKTSCPAEQLLQGFRIRLHWILEIDDVAPGFRRLVHELEQLHPEELLVDYGFYTEDTAYQICTYGDPVVAAGAFSTRRHPKNLAPSS